MNPYFMKYTDDVYYTDTDSIALSTAIPDAEVGNGIGQMKLENIRSKGYFVGNKVYAL